MAFTRLLQASALALASFLLIVEAQNPSFANVSSQCADPTGFNACWANATSTAQTCYSSVARCANSGSCTDENTCSSTAADCSVNCVCSAYTNWINCALTSCWNMIYSCEYQNLAIQAATSCPGAGQGPANTPSSDGYLPYTPPPASAPAACSCAISTVLYQHAAAKRHGAACASREANSTSASAAELLGRERCRCCAASASVGAFFGACAGTAPGAVPRFEDTVGESWAVLRSAACVAVLEGEEAFDCRGLRFAQAGGGEFLTAGDVPANGTAVLSDVVGNVIASPVGGPTVVWRLGEKFPNVTAVAAPAAGTTSSTASPNAGGFVRGDVPVLPLVWVLSMFGLGMWML